MTDYRLLEDGTSRRLLEDGTSIRLLESANPSVSSNVKIRGVRLQSPLSTGTQDYVVTGFGTPKAALFICSRATADGTAETTASGLAIGAADGTTQFCFGMSAGGADAERVSLTNACAFHVSNGGGTFTEAAFSSFIDGGVRINWSKVHTTRRFVTVILFGGDDLEAKVGAPTLGNQDVESHQNTIGFEPNLVLGATSLQPTTGSATTATLCFGAVTNDGAGTVVQRCVGFTNRDVTTTIVTASVRNDAGLVSVSNDTLNWRAQFQDFDVDGFSIFPRGGDAGAVVGFLALKTGTRAAWVGSVDAPTSAASDWTVTGPGFEPMAFLLGLSMAQAENTVLTDGDAGAFGVGFASPNEEFVNFISARDAVSTRVERGVSDDQFVRLFDDTGTESFNALSPTFNASGFTIPNANITAANATQRKWFGVAIEAEAATGETLPADSGSFTLTGNTANLLKGYVLNAESASFDLVGNDSDLLHGRILSAQLGEFTLTGGDASLVYGDTLAAESGSFTLVGQDVGLLKGGWIEADSGDFSLIGQDASLSSGAVLIAESGGFLLAGQDMEITQGITLVAETGSFVMTGQDVEFSKTNVLIAESGTFLLVGQDVTLDKGGEAIVGGRFVIGQVYYPGFKVGQVTIFS